MTQLYWHKEFDDVRIHNIYDETGENVIASYIIARNEDDKETIILTRDLSEISRDDCGLHEAYDIVEEHYGKEVSEYKSKRK